MKKYIFLSFLEINIDVMKEEIFQQIKIQARQYFRNARGSHDFDHTLRVCRLAERIAESENADREVVRFSAILHDTGRQEEDENHGRVCHAEIGARMAREMLDEYNLDASFISHVADCILSHRFRTGNKPRTIEAKALYDADKLDSIGAVGVGRAFLFAGEIRAGLHDKNIRVEETKPYTKDDTAYR